MQEQHTCAVDCCGTIARNGHKYCSPHEHRYYRYGDPLGGGVYVESNRNVYQRFFDHVEVTDTCWLWVGAKTKGYGAFSFNRQAKQAHRISYQWFVGEIPDNLVLDHLCRVTNCVNPSHLEPVTNRENVVVRGIGTAAAHSRKEFCKYGHPLSGDNVRLRHKYTNGIARVCIACESRRNYEYRESRATKS